MISLTDDSHLPWMPAFPTLDQIADVWQAWDEHAATIADVWLLELGDNAAHGWARRMWRAHGAMFFPLTRRPARDAPSLPALLFCRELRARLAFEPDPHATDLLPHAYASSYGSSGGPRCGPLSPIIEVPG